MLKIFHRLLDILLMAALFAAVAHGQTVPVQQTVTIAPATQTTPGLLSLGQVQALIQSQMQGYQAQIAALQAQVKTLQNSPAPVPVVPQVSKIGTSGQLADALGTLPFTRLAPDLTENSFWVWGSGTNGDNSPNAPKPAPGTTLLRYFNACPAAGTSGACIATASNGGPWKVVLQ